MKNEDNTLALDTNKWLKLVEEIENPSNARKWREYLNDHNFKVILPQLVFKELVWLLTNKESANSRIWLERKSYILRLMKVGQVFDFQYVRSSKEFIHYLKEAERLIKEYKLNEVLDALGLYESEEGIKKYYLHKSDLAILVSLKELNTLYYFLTHDEKLRRALMVREVKNALVKEGIQFILIYETQNTKNRILSRIKVLPEIRL